jgi:hypothetical protein
MAHIALPFFWFSRFSIGPPNILQTGSVIQVESAACRARGAAGMAAREARGTCRPLVGFMMAVLLFGGLR